MPGFLFADKLGRLFDLPGVEAVGRSGDCWFEIEDEDLVPLPEGATLTLIPERYPVGIDEDTEDFKVFHDNPYTGEEIWAVGALLPQGFTRTLLPGFASKKGAKVLPLLGYTAVAVIDDKYYVAAVKTDEDKKWNPKYYNTQELEELVDKMLARFPENRILKQLAKCSLEYGCFTAQNIFYSRWEGGIPVSPGCNANCLGCISLQPSECCPSPQNRIKFIPTVEEISDLAEHHLRQGEDAIISFGQGCEGEPTLQGELLVESVERIRKKTDLGTININTNGSRPEIIEKLSQKGLQSIRVSLISASESTYNSYYRPEGYGLEDVKKSLQVARENGVFTAINLLTIPGLTDSENEIEKLLHFLKDTGVSQLQFRNLNIDPDYLLEVVAGLNGEIVGIANLIKILREEFPHLKIGNYTLPVK